MSKKIKLNKLWLLPTGLIQPLLWWFINAIIHAKLQVDDYDPGLSAACFSCALLFTIALLIAFAYYNSES